MFGLSGRPACWPAPDDARGSVPCTVMKVVVYSHDADVRAQIRLAIGRRPAMDVPDAEIIEVATQPALFRLLDAGGADVMVLDGEAQPIGGMGLCRQAKDEIYKCPPALLIVGRADDGLLATWARAGPPTAGWPPGRGPTRWSATRSTRSRWPRNWPG